MNEYSMLSIDKEVLINIKDPIIGSGNVETWGVYLSKKKKQKLSSINITLLDSQLRLCLVTKKWRRKKFDCSK